MKFLVYIRFKKREVWLSEERGEIDTALTFVTIAHSFHCGMNLCGKIRLTFVIMSLGKFAAERNELVTLIFNFFRPYLKFMKLVTEIACRTELY